MKPFACSLWDGWITKVSLRTLVILPAVLAGALISPTASATLWQVGPTRADTTLQAVANKLKAGDVVEVDGDASYPGNVTFEKNGTAVSNIVISGLRVNGRRPVLSGTNLPSGTKTVVSLLGSNYVFQGFEIHGALNANISKAGLYHNADQTIIRDTLVRDCYHNGIQGADASGSLTLDKVEVFNCGSGLSYHQIYVASDNVNYSNAVFRMQFCYIHNGRGGNNVKSRVGRNELYYNWIEEAKYLELDLIGADPAAQAPNTADLVREDSDVVGNVLCKLLPSQNFVARLGSDDTGSSDGRYRFVNNTIVLANTFSTYVFGVSGPRQSVELHNNVIYRASGGGVKLVDSISPALGVDDGFYGFNNWLPSNTTYIPTGLSQTLMGDTPYFADNAGREFMPTNASPLLDAGQLPTQSPNDFPFPSPLAAPLYLPPEHTAPDPDIETARPDRPPIDIGAYETLALPPILLQQPVSLVKTQGQVALFAVVAAGSLTAANPLQYQWYCNDLALVDATNASYSLPVVGTKDTGTYQVIVTNTFGAVTSSIASLVVHSDTNNPTIAITYPAVNGRVTTNQVLLKGSARDNIVVADVQLKLNDGAYVAADVTNGTAGSASWSLPVLLTPGTNTISVYAADAAGNFSVTNSRTFFYAFPTPLNVIRIGEGKVTPNYNTSNLFVGRNYSMTAAPTSTNWLFTNWLAVVDGVTNVASDLRKLPFTMQSNLTLIAQFVTNRFIAAAGTYSGLFWDTNNGVAWESAGFVTIKVNSKPAFSGTLCLAGEKRTFSGRFDLAGSGVPLKPVTFKGNTNTVTMNLQLPFDGTDTISGSVSNNNDGSWVSNLSGNRAVFSSANPPLDFLGLYTLVVPHATNGPAGDGYGVINIASNGIIKLVGQLGDGVAWSQAVPSGKTGEWPLFTALYNKMNDGVRVKAGLIMGWLSVSNKPDGNVYWIKTPVITDQFYPDGFTNETSVASSTYTNSALFTNAIIALTNGTLILDDGNLSTTLTNSVTLSALNEFTCSTNYGLKLTVAKATGKLGGTFNHPDNGGLKTPVHGVVLQDSNTAYGFFKGTNQTGTFLLQSN